ncbi:hypothetical protein AB4421_00865 [Vibrio breoganii]
MYIRTILLLITSLISLNSHAHFKSYVTGGVGSSLPDGYYYFSSVHSAVSWLTAQVGCVLMQDANRNHTINSGLHITTTDSGSYWRFDVYPIKTSCGVSQAQLDDPQTYARTWYFDKSATSYTCPAGTTPNDTDGTCGSICEPLAGNSQATNWDYFQYGSSPTICSSSCELDVEIAVCFISTGSCSGDAIITGQGCSTEGFTAGGTIPDEVPAGCENFDGTFICAEDTDGDGQPNDGAQLDVASRCGYDSSDKFVCTGGSYADADYEFPDSTNLVDTVSSGSITESDFEVSAVEAPTAPTEQTDTTKQIKLLNEQVNELLTSFNQDSNDNFKNVIDELKDSNEYNKQQIEQIVTSTNKQIEIWQNLKSLQVTTTQDIVNSINDTADYDEYYHNESMQKQDELIQAIQQIKDSNSTLEETITNVDSTIDTNFSEVTPSYVSENGEQLEETITNRLLQTKDTLYSGVLESFATIDLSGAAKPDFSLDMTGFGFGSYDLESYVDLDYIFAFVRVCILFTTAMTCRKIVFGG